MRTKFCVLCAFGGLLFAGNSYGQEKTDSTVMAPHAAPNKRNQSSQGHYLSLTTGGFSFGYSDTAKQHQVDKRKENQSFRMNYAIVDLGLNLLMDHTNYSGAAARNLLEVPTNMQNKSLFDLRTWKSVNVNIYPWMVRFKALKTRNQRIYISSGIGLQLYNFRYESPLTWTRNPVGVIMDTVSFKKDKLALNYLSVPLMFTFKTRLRKDNWLVYGTGLSEGFLVESWTKQESGARGKVKVFDQFGLNQFSTCFTAEIGIEGEFRLFFTYQLTSMFQSALDQHPLCIGFRFGGI